MDKTIRWQPLLLVVVYILINSHHHLTCKAATSGQQQGAARQYHQAYQQSTTSLGGDTSRRISPPQPQQVAASGQPGGDQVWPDFRSSKLITKRDHPVELRSLQEADPPDDSLISSSASSARAKQRSSPLRSEDVCSDRLCFGLPMGCLDRSPTTPNDRSRVESSGSLCSVLVTSKRFIDPYRPVARDIHFELVALPADGRSNYAAVGFSETGRMAGLVSECLQYRDANNRQLQVIKLAHSYNIPGLYQNVPVKILSGIINLGVSYEDGYYQCRWIVQSAVEFTYEEPNGTVVNRREDLGYRNYHILLASGEYNEKLNCKSNS